ncbi:MAG: FxsA family protein [Gammaproteobacteria bacterium]|nr:FxsA family protein [Gammaproteobacteria bacterium]
MNPVFLLLLLFVGLPLFELYFLIQVGSEFGAIPTIALSVFTAVLGGLLVRVQGVSTLLRVRASLEKDQVPAIEMLEGVVLLITGFFLLLPGFLTDFLGFLCLVPAIRRALVLSFLRRTGTTQPPPSAPGQPQQSTKVIEGEFQREDD